MHSKSLLKLETETSNKREACDDKPPSRTLAHVITRLARLSVLEHDRVEAQLEPTGVQIPRPDRLPE